MILLLIQVKRYTYYNGIISDSIEKMIIEKDYSRTLKSLGGESAEEN